MLTPPTLAPKLLLITGDGKEKKNVVVSPAKTTPPVAAPRKKSLPSPAQKPPSTPTRDNGPLPKIPQNIKKTYLYIANCEPTYTRDLLKAHINRSTSSNLVLSDIIELNTKNRGKSFKVAVPENKKDVVLSIWQAGIKAEPYRIQKPAKVTGQQVKGRKDNMVQRHSFQGPKSYTSNKSRNPQHQSKRPQQTYRQSRNQPYRRDFYQVDEYPDWHPYQYNDYREQPPYQNCQYSSWGSRYQQPEQRYYSQSYW